MNQTPRLRSAFPGTPPSSARSSRTSQTPNSTTRSPRVQDIRSLDPPKDSENGPRVPFETIDAPSQRLYAAAIYVLLVVWRSYDFFKLHQDQEESFWLFLKWIAIDSTFLFGLPSFRIPWLEWSPTTMTVLFMVHAVWDAILMFRIPIPLGSALLAVTKMMWDREIAIAEHSVKPASILQDPSHILGKYEIHVLPEGSALLNPSSIPLCIESTRSSSVSIPLQINQTNPTSIELHRYDLKTAHNETTKITASQIRRLLRSSTQHPSGAILLEHSVYKTGLYRLGKVTDQSNLEVGHPYSEALVVQCPKARIKPSGANRCKNDLSNIAIEVEGSPPMKIKYRKSVNGEDRDVTYQSIQPDDFVSPAIRKSGQGALITSSYLDLSGALPARVDVPLNETLLRSGVWSYSVDEVSDAYGNSVSYRDPSAEYEQPRPKAMGLDDSFTVHERPIVSLNGHYTKNPIRAAAGKPVDFPLQFQSNIKQVEDTNFQVTYRFSPSEDLSNEGTHTANSRVATLRAKRGQMQSVTEPGLYTLQSVKTDHCNGEVEEPSSFVITNPPEPSIDLHTQKLNDKCADRQIGLRVEFNMTGTPPYSILYTSQRTGDHITTDVAHFEGPRGQLDFTPEKAGHWTYRIVGLDDALYEGVDLRRRNLVLEQDVRPSVFASFSNKAPTRNTCIDEPVNYEIRFQGEGPWSLEYELVHGKQRSKHEIPNIQSDVHTITTERLTKGGEYSLALIGVKDGQGCRETLQQDAKISVRHQRPRAAFGQIEGKRAVRTLESKDVQLPLRLAGEGPWTVEYRHQVNDTVGNTLQGPVVNARLQDANQGLEVEDPGTYELVGVNDALCPGTIDDSARLFDVKWVDRPQLRIPESPYIERRGDVFVRSDVCEGQEDAVDIAFIGRPPFGVKYQEQIKPDHGSKSVRPVVEMNVPVSSAQVKMDTAQAGLYEYTFTELSDYNYDYDPKRHRPLSIQQRVNGRPSVAFTNPGKVHSFCQDSFKDASQASESVPIKLQGLPPFTIDLEIRNQGSSKALKPKTITIPNIVSTTHSLQIPHTALQSGSSNVVIRKVRDSRGCERFYDAPSSIPSQQKASQTAGNDAPRVQVAVHAAPSLKPAEPHRREYCVGERIGFTLTGTPPFNVMYSFNNQNKKVAVSGSTFRRMAEKPGNFTITGVSDGASGCTADVKGVSKIIHDLPRVKVSKGKDARYDIHAGGSVDVSFEFTGEAPFDFTYTRSGMIKQKGAAGGYRQGPVLDTRTLRSYEKLKRVSESEEGMYEVVAIRDKFCSYAKQGYEGIVSGTGVEGAGRALDGPEAGEEHLLEL